MTSARHDTLTLAELRSDLRAEHDALDAVVAALDDGQWGVQTPSPRWTVADQIAHLAYFDDTASIAISDPDRFQILARELFAAGEAATGAEGSDEVTLGHYRTLGSPELLAEWRANRAALDSAASGLAEDARIAWYGPSMGARSFLTARLMETWAHGQDIIDSVGGHRESTDRLRHIAQLGFITRAWTYRVREREVPTVPVRLELAAPSGATWTYGPGDAAERIGGLAEAFCQVVTQRRHVDDTDLQIVGASAREWMLLSQAFAGAPTDGPSAGSA